MSKEIFKQPPDKFNSRVFKLSLFSAIFLIPLLASTEYLWAHSSIIFFGSITLTLISFEILKLKNIEFVNTLIFRLILLIFAGLAVSLISFPPFVVKVFSPGAFELYKNYLPDYSRFFNTLPIKTFSLYPHNTFIGLAAVFSFFIIFFSLINKFDSFHLRLRMVNMIIFSATIVTCLGIVNMFIQNKKIFWVMNIISGTPTGPFINTIHFASFMALCIPLTLGVWIAKVDFKVKDCPFGKVKKTIHKMLIFIKNSIVYLLPALLMILALFKALSRGAIISFFLSMALFILLLTLKSKTRRKAALLLLLLVLFILLVFAVDSFDIKSKILNFINIRDEKAIFSQDVTQRIGTLKNIFETDSARTRFSVWKDTVKMFFDFPVFGTGLNTFSVIFPKYKTIYGSGKMFFTHAENDYIETSSEIGFLGFVLLLAGAAIFLRNVFFNFKSENDPGRIGILAGGISSVFALLFCAVTDFPFHIPSISFIFVLICFIIWPKARKRKIIKFSQAGRRKIKFIVIMSVLFFISLSLLMSAVKLFAAELFFYGFSYSQGSLDTRIKLLEKAIFFDASNADYRYALGKFNFDKASLIKDKNEQGALRLIKQAEINFSKAIELQPTNWKYHFFDGSAEFILASLGVEGHSSKKAQSSFDKALALNPNEYEIYNYLGNYYLATEPEKAFRYYKKLISHKPYYLSHILEIIWKVSHNVEFIREAVPDDPNLLINYADFLKAKGEDADRFYKESAIFVYKLKNRQDKENFSGRLAVLGYFKQADDCLLDMLESDPFFKRHKEKFVIVTLSPEQLIEEEKNISRLQRETALDSYELLYKLALFHYQMKDYNKALEYFRNLVKVYPVKAELRFKLSLVLYRTGEYKEAYEELQKSIFSIKQISSEK